MLSVTLVPVLMMLFIRGSIMPEARNPVNRVHLGVQAHYRVGDAVEKTTLLFAVALLGITVYPASRLGVGIHAHSQ